MRHHRRLLDCALAWLALWLMIPSVVIATPDEIASSAQGEVRVVLEVRVTEVDPLSPSLPSAIYASGNLESLGRWRPKGLRLEPSSDGLFRAEFTVAEGTDVEFKITAGSWQQVEKDTQGRDIANRRFKVQSAVPNQPQRVSITVASLAISNSTESKVTGRLVIHERVESKSLVATRNVSVWLPPGYENSTDRYPVLYLQDGQNLFDAATAAFGVEWRADETATQLIADKKITPVILVGVWNTADRVDEYTLTKDNQLQRGGLGAAYIDFLADELKPFIDRTYRTQPDRESTWVGGSSLGGLISIHACLQRPDVYGGCLSFSPSLGWDDERLLNTLSSEAHWPNDLQLWFSMGTAEGRNAEAHALNVSRARRLAKQLTENKSNHSARIRYCEFPDANHNENAWSLQFSDSLTYAWAVSVDK